MTQISWYYIFNPASCEPTFSFTVSNCFVYRLLCCVDQPEAELLRIDAALFYHIRFAFYLFHRKQCVANRKTCFKIPWTIYVSYIWCLIFEKISQTSLTAFIYCLWQSLDWLSIIPVWFRALFFKLRTCGYSVWLNCTKNKADPNIN